MSDEPEELETEPMAPVSEGKRAFGKARRNDRRCVGTGEVLAPGDPALRFVRAPSEEIVLDLKGSLPGRGVWLTPKRGALVAAVRRGGFQRGFRARVRLPGDVDAEGFADRVEEQIAAAALSRLGLARKAGSLVIGHDNVRAAAQSGIAYLTPRDASAPETEKLARLLHKASNSPHLPLPTDRSRLGLSLGQDAVHVLLLRGGPSRGALERVILWQRFAG